MIKVVSFVPGPVPIAEALCLKNKNFSVVITPNQIPEGQLVTQLLG
jgi:hypothetical protein